MKKVFYPFVLLLAASVIFTGCRDDEQHGDGSQTIKSQSFTTLSPWTSSVHETTGTRTTAEATASTRSTVDWLTFSPQSGGAGTHIITINIEPNRTGAERSAIITIESEELRVRIEVEQPYVPGGDGDILLSEEMEPIYLYFDAATIQSLAIDVFVSISRYHPHLPNLYYELDNRYSTYTSRQTLSPQTSIVNQFWTNSYRTIGRANHLLTAVPECLERRPNDEDAKRAFLENKGGVLASKGLMYFYLSTKFGGVPLVTTDNWNNLDYLPSRASRSEVTEFVRTTLKESLQYLENGQNPWDSELLALSYRVLALIALQKQEYQQAADYLQQSIGVLHNTHTTFLLYAEALTQTYLLYAETLLKIGQNAQAITRVNQVLQETGKEQLPPDATDDEILAAIKDSFSDVDSGMKFLNAVRWGETESWGFRALLPIPQHQITMNPNLTQNPGWW